MLKPFWLMLLLVLWLYGCELRPTSPLLAGLPPFQLQSQVLDPAFLWRLEQKLTANGATLDPQAQAFLSLGVLERRERRQFIAIRPRQEEVEVRHQFIISLHWNAETLAASQKLESYQRYLLEPERPLASRRSEAEQDRRALFEMEGQILQFLANLALSEKPNDRGGDKRNVATP